MSIKEPTGEEPSFHTFPSDFTFKVFGHDDDAFKQAAQSIVEKNFPHWTKSDSNWTEKMSKGHKFLCLSITVHADNKAQVDATYQALTDAPEVLMSI